MVQNFKTKTQSDKDKTISISYGLCKSCGLCKEVCPVKCIEWSKKEKGIYGAPSIEIDLEKCTACQTCVNICPDCVIKIERKAAK